VSHRGSRLAGGFFVDRRGRPAYHRRCEFRNRFPRREWPEFRTGYTHNTTEPKQKLDLVWRNVEWFDEYLGAGKPSAEIDTK
jgi:hypothetical protein